MARVKAFRRYNITVCANLMFGFDADTDATFDHTYHFIKTTKLVPNPYVLTPYPGTPLYDDMVRHRRLLHTDYTKYTAYQTVFRPTNFSPEDLDKSFTRFFRRVYNVPNILRRFFSMLKWRSPVGSFFTQLAIMRNSLQVRYNVRHGILPYY
ncbi:MAG: DUF4070 domain-containing protein [Deltaproteobacteria bacterium]|nr:DUF4070 domain-containing protein [Deltaproteobacteria bacterium]